MTRFVSQAAAVLFESDPPLDSVAACLGRFAFAPFTPSAADLPWLRTGPALVSSFRPEVNGRVLVDVCGFPWPDSMGNTTNHRSTFEAWVYAAYGPHAYPGNLSRASQQAWHWREASGVVARHRRFVRIRTTYILGSEESAPVRPNDWDPVGELRYVTEIGYALLSLPSSLAWFAPAGEMLCSPEQLSEDMERVRNDATPPIELWSNVRLHRLQAEKPAPDWFLMDTVGMEQFGHTDHEACFCDTDRISPTEVARFLRNISLHVLRLGPVVNDGDTADGPDGRKWRARRVKEGRFEPPRETLRWSRAEVELPAPLRR